MTWFIRQFRQEQWSPYFAGAMLGIIVILTVLLANTLLGASGGFENLAGILGTAIAPAAFNNMYFKYIMRPEITFGVVLLVGVFFGGMLGALSSGTFKLRWNDDPVWNAVIGPQRWKRWVIGFFGAILLEYSAGIAGGCTSGLAISGGTLLAPSAFLFIAGMFASGLVTSLIVYRRRY